MPNVNLSEADIRAVATALDLWANYIQTGDVTASAADLARANDPKRRPKALDADQMRTVVALVDLRDKLLAAGFGGIG